MTDLADFDGLAADQPATAQSTAETLLDQAASDVAEVQGSQTRTIYLAIRAGIRLVAAKQETGHGSFTELLESKGWKERTARNYMKLALSMRDALELKPNEVQLLLSAQPRLTDKGTVSIDARPTLSKKIAKWIDDRTLTEVMQDLGIRRELKAPKKDADAPEPDSDTEDPPLTEADNARSVWFGQSGEGGLLTDLRIWGLQEKSYGHLPQKERRDILDLLTDLTKELKASLA